MYCILLIVWCGAVYSHHWITLFFNITTWKHGKLLITYVVAYTKKYTQLFSYSVIGGWPASGWHIPYLTHTETFNLVEWVHEQLYNNSSHPY